MTAQTIAVADGQALGSGVRLAVAGSESLPAAWRAVSDLLDEVDLAASRFRDDSELAAVLEVGEPVVVSPLLADLVACALRAAEVTGGLVDPTVGEAVRAAGYDVDFARVPADGEALVVRVRPVPGWRSIGFDGAARRLHVPPGVELDLGATAKGRAADLCAAAAVAAGAAGALVSLGGDVATAGTAPEGGWVIQVSEDSDAAIDASQPAISVASGGVATSSTTVRRWRRGGVELHHILDPRTGLPVEGPWRTATTVAAGCLDANIASTAAIVLGPAAVDWLEARRIPARLVGNDGSVRVTRGWPEPGEIA